MKLAKLPVPVPSVVLLSAVVGVAFVLQQTPRAVTEAPPSEVTVPPLCAVVGAIAVTEEVDNTGAFNETVVNSQGDELVECA
jgi:hypothetical protein